MAEPSNDNSDARDPNQSPQWLSYLMPGSTVLRTVAGLTDPSAVAIFERIVSADAEAALRADPGRTGSLDVAHLDDLHGRLFGEVYAFAGQHRYVDTQKPGQSGEPFLHHRWIGTYADIVVDQLRAEDNLTGLTDPGQWADRAAYYQAAFLHAHPYREGNGRAVRLFLEDLAERAGHTLDWTRSGGERKNTVAIAAAHGDYEPARALLSVVAGGTSGVDRPVTTLNDLDKYLHAQAWARTGLVFGTGQERQTVTGQLIELGTRLAVVTEHLSAQYPTRATSLEQPATDRWRGVVASIHPSLTEDQLWPEFAAELDASSAAGIDVAAELPRMARPDPARPAVTPDASAPAPPSAAPQPAYRNGYAPDPVAAPAAAQPHVPPPGRSGPRR